MKRITAILVVCLLMGMVSTFGVSADTQKKDWGRMTGPAEMTITSEGTTLETSEGLTFYKYTRDMIDIKNFSCTFTLDSENWFDSHEGEHQYYYTITLTDKAAHSGSKGLFLLLMPTSGRSMRIEGQILNTGYLLSPSYVEFDVDTLSDIVMHGKVLAGTGADGGDQYQISFDNCEQTYTFDIPLNYQFQTANNGSGYFSFGAGANGFDKQKITIKKVNDIEMTGTSEPESSKEETASGTGAVASDAGTSTPTTGQAESGSTANLGSGTLLILIIGMAVLFLIVVAGFVVLLLFMNKKMNNLIDNNSKQ